MGGNSLAEVLVFGRRAGEAAAAHSEALQAQLRASQAVNAAHEELDSLIHEGDELARPLQRAVRDTMWAFCGVVRDEARLQQGLEKLAEVKAAAAHVDVRPSSEGYKDLALALDLRGSLVAAEATIRPAVERRESRGAHQRADYPDLDPDLQVNFRIRLNKNGEIELWPTAVPPIPDDLQQWIEDGEELGMEGRLLE